MKDDVGPHTAMATTCRLLAHSWLPDCLPDDHQDIY